MVTRADFYVKHANNMCEWLGSIAFDGCVESIDKKILNSNNTHKFKSRVKHFVKNREDGSLPKDGWPWPWTNSRLTDYTYLFISPINVVYFRRYDSLWVSYLSYLVNDGNFEKCNGVEEDEDFLLPDMSDFQNIATGMKEERLKNCLDKIIQQIEDYKSCSYADMAFNGNISLKLMQDNIQIIKDIIEETTNQKGV